MPDVVQGGEKGLAKILFSFNSFARKFRQCGCAGWGLSLVWSCGPKVGVGGGKQKKAAPIVPFHIQGEPKPCPRWIRDEQKYQTGFRKRLKEK